jgi:hypothetical protein
MPLSRETSIRNQARAMAVLAEEMIDHKILQRGTSKGSVMFTEDFLDHVMYYWGIHVESMPKRYETLDDRFQMAKVVIKIMEKEYLIHDRTQKAEFTAYVCTMIADFMQRRHGSND